MPPDVRIAQRHRLLWSEDHFRLRMSEETIALVIALLAHGCPVPAIVIAFGLDERMVAQWQTRSGQRSCQVDQQLVARPRDPGQVPGDEISAKLQGLKAWLAMAMQVSTRFWLGGVVAVQRDRSLIEQWVWQMRARALPRLLLICVDGLASYVTAIRRVFSSPLPRHGRRVRQRVQPWRGVYIAQDIKQYARRQVVVVKRRIVQGRWTAVQRLIERTQGAGSINTSYIERLNATFRARMANLVRRGRTLAKGVATLEHGMYLVGMVYHFCTDHDSLRLRRQGRPDKAGRRWHLRTPAMAAGLTDHRGTVYELLAYPVPPPRSPLKGHASAHCPLGIRPRLNGVLPSACHFETK